MEKAERADAAAADDDDDDHHCSLSAMQRQPVRNSHDGLNLTCLDQCHGVGSHGTSSSQGRRKKIVIQQSEFDPRLHKKLNGNLTTDP